MPFSVGLLVGLFLGFLLGFVLGIGIARLHARPRSSSQAKEDLILPGQTWELPGLGPCTVTEIYFSDVFFENNKKKKFSLRTSEVKKYGRLMEHYEPILDFEKATR